MGASGSRPTLREERKVVTALFADLVGSTTIGERFDPEDAREIMSGAISRIIGVVEHLGGTVKDVAGDGVLALFGAPDVHEDDAERAVLTGLGIVAEIATYGRDVVRDWGYEGFGVRVGIETGLAVLGPVGAGGHIEYGAVGDVLNTAARLQAQAEPATVVVGSAARREVEALFEWGDARPLTLKGKREPVLASVVLRRKSGRQDRRELRGVWAPLVARSRELAVAEQALSELADGHGSILLLVGDPGIGKSRLVAECRGRALSGRYGTVDWLEGRCLSHGEGVPYSLFRDLFSSWLATSPADSAETIGAAFHQAVGVPASSVLLEHVLDTRAVAREGSSLGSDAEALRQRVFSDVRDTLVRATDKGPIVLVLEDLHWADPTSLELCEQLLEIVDHAPVLLVLSRRSELGHASATLADRARDRLGARARTIELLPLQEGDDVQLLESLVGRDTLPSDVRKAILATTEGNPFFLEEQIKAFIDAGALVHDAGRWRFVEGATAEVPRSVERVLLARIDRLGPRERDGLVAASVLGREFDRALLEASIDGGGSIRQILVDLERLDLVRSEDRGSETRFRFTHALIQEAAYRSLLKRKRRELHGRAAAALEEMHPGTTNDVAGALGHHLTEAGEFEKAVPFLIAAGDHAREAFANEEALAWYRRARRSIEEQPSEDDERWRRMLADLHEREGQILKLRSMHREARLAFRRSIELTAPASSVDAARLHTRAASVESGDHRYDAALAHLDEAESVLGFLLQAEQPDPDRLSAWLEIQSERMEAFYWMDDQHSFAELIERVRPQVDAHATAAQRTTFFESLATFGARRDRFVITEETLGYARSAFAAATEGADAGATAWARFNLGFIQLWAGDLEAARALIRESEEEGERMGDATLRSRCLTYLMVLARKRGDVEEVRAAVDPVIDAAKAASLPEYEAMALANRAWVALRTGSAAEVEADARAALELWRNLPVRYPFDWMALWPLLSVEVARGRTAEAIECTRAMLPASQQPLPEELQTAIEGAVDAWEAGRHEEAIERLRHSMDAAHDLAFL